MQALKPGQLWPSPWHPHVTRSLRGWRKSVPWERGGGAQGWTPTCGSLHKVVHRAQAARACPALSAGAAGKVAPGDGQEAVECVCGGVSPTPATQDAPQKACSLQALKEHPVS